MFDGGTSESTELACVRSGPDEANWKWLHRQLRGIATERVMLEAKEVGFLIEAPARRLVRQGRESRATASHA